jgi:hypothetical protein
VITTTDRNTAMGRIVDRSQELLAGRGGWGRFGFYTTGQQFLEEYCTLGVLGKGELVKAIEKANARATRKARAK